MTRLSFFFILIPLLSVILLSVTFILAPHEPYKEKETPFECGYHSFLQTRNQFAISFFVFGLLFLLFDLEIVLIYPYSTSSLFNGIYGLVSIVIFILILTLGFVFEIGKKALNIESKDSKILLNQSLLPNMITLKSYCIAFVFFTCILYGYNYHFGMKFTSIICVMNIMLVLVLKYCLEDKPLEKDIFLKTITVFIIVFMLKLFINTCGEFLYSNYMELELDLHGFYIGMDLEYYTKNVNLDASLSIVAWFTGAYAIAGVAEEYLSSAGSSSSGRKLHNLHMLYSQSNRGGDSEGNMSSSQGSDGIHNSGALGGSSNSLSGNNGTRRTGLSIAEMLNTPSPVDVATSRSSSPVPVPATGSSTSDPIVITDSPSPSIQSTSVTTVTNRNSGRQLNRLERHLFSSTTIDNTNPIYDTVRVAFREATNYTSSINASNPESVKIDTDLNRIPDKFGIKKTLNSFTYKNIFYKELLDVNKEINRAFGPDFTYNRYNFFNDDGKKSLELWTSVRKLIQNYRGTNEAVSEFTAAEFQLALSWEIMKITNSWKRG